MAHYGYGTLYLLLLCRYVHCCICLLPHLPNATEVNPPGSICPAIGFNDIPVHVEFDHSVQILHVSLKTKFIVRSRSSNLNTQITNKPLLKMWSLKPQCSPSNIAR